MVHRPLTYQPQTESAATPFRSIELDIDIGADARDWSSIQVQEKLKPVEGDLRRIEEMVGEIVNEMEYLRSREQTLRDTNESTNERVKWFAFGTMGMLIGLGAWQVVYLRAYFRYVLDIAQLVNESTDAMGTDQSILFRSFLIRWMNGWAWCKIRSSLGFLMHAACLNSYDSYDK